MQDYLHLGGSGRRPRAVGVAPVWAQCVLGGLGALTPILPCVALQSHLR